MATIVSQTRKKRDGGKEGVEAKKFTGAVKEKRHNSDDFVEELFCEIQLPYLQGAVAALLHAPKKRAQLQCERILKCFLAVVFVFHPCCFYCCFYYY